MSAPKKLKTMATSVDLAAKCINNIRILVITCTASSPLGTCVCAHARAAKERVFILHLDAHNVLTPTLHTHKLTHLTWDVLRELATVGVRVRCPISVCCGCVCAASRTNESFCTARFLAFLPTTDDLA
jgi:hypothetical protein